MLALVHDELARAYPNAGPPRLQGRSVNIDFCGTDIGYDVLEHLLTEGV
ncbi:hypothetical protein [Nannocystis exedens]|nr:hypothetical protein [Nannocystis exedens]PCC74680.1 hypothetical protein NAEX_07777 [Nannocystis exedens]